MAIRTHKIEIEISEGTWDIDILIDREPTPVIIATLTNEKTKNVDFDTQKYYAYRYAITAPSNTEFKISIDGAVFAPGKTNDSNTARGRGPL